MDKALVLTALLLIATPIVALTLGIGWLMDDDKRKRDIDLDMRIYVPMRYRGRSSDNRHDNRMGKGEEK